MDEALVVGAPARTNGFDPCDWPIGTASRYRETPGGVELEQKVHYSQVVVSSGGRPPLFGTAVGLSGNRAVFSIDQGYRQSFGFGGGAPGRSGAVIYEAPEEGGEWTRNEYFGEHGAAATALDGNDLIIGFPSIATAHTTPLPGIGTAALIDLSISRPLSPQQVGVIPVSLLPTRAIAIWGNTTMTAVGLEGEEFGPDPGRVAVYSFDGASWQRTAVLGLPDNPEFGRSISLHGDTAVVGDGEKSHVFVRDGDTWILQIILDEPDGEIFDDRIAAGTKIFRRNGRLEWDEVSILPITGEFRRLRHWDDWVAVETSSGQRLRVELFKLAEDNSIITSQSLHVTNSKGFRQTGNLALDEGLLVVADSSNGAVKSSQLNGNSWSQLQNISYSDPNAPSFLPNVSLALSRGMLLIGQSYGVLGNGRVQFLKWKGSGFDHEQIVEAPVQIPGGLFGERIALSAGTALVGSESMVRSYKSVQDDGRRFVSGYFSGVNGMDHWNLAAFDEDWSYDSNFSGSHSFFRPRILTLASSGRIVVALGASDAATIRPASVEFKPSLLSFDHTGMIRWHRGPGHPLTRQVHFEVSLNDGQNWFLLGQGERVDETWTFADSSIPSWASIRARARVENGSSSLYEAMLPGQSGQSAIEQWRITHFGTPDNSGAGADDNDPTGSGLTNLVRFATGISPEENSLNILKLITSDGNPILSYPRSKLALWSGVNFQIEQNENLNEGGWEPVTSVTRAEVIQGAIEKVALTLNPSSKTMFYRLSVKR